MYHSVKLKNLEHYNDGIQNLDLEFGLNSCRRMMPIRMHRFSLCVTLLIFGLFFYLFYSHEEHSILLCSDARIGENDCCIMGEHRYCTAVFVALKKRDEFVLKVGASAPLSHLVHYSNICNF